MQKYTSQNTKKFQHDPKGTPRTFKVAQDRSINRFQQNAARLEHSNVRNKNKGKKG